MTSAIEIYNKPDFRYREETFAILSLNAWELLFKAFILYKNNNKLNSIYVYYQKVCKDGKKSKRRYIKRNRAGNAMTIDLSRAMNLIVSRGYSKLDPAIKANITSLMEIRDNAIHFINVDIGFSKLVQELGSATLKNYVKLVKQWFDYDLSQYNFYLMPLAFFRTFESASAVNMSNQEKNVIKFIADMSNEYKEAEEYDVLLELDVKLKKSNSTPEAYIDYSNKNPNAIPVKVEEEDLRELYPWDYDTLYKTLKKRYTDFKQNEKFYNIRRPLMNDRRYVMRRFLDPNNTSGSKKDFYSPNILNVFDEHYTRRN